MIWKYISNLKLEYQFTISVSISISIPIPISISISQNYLFESPCSLPFENHFADSFETWQILST